MTNQCHKWVHLKCTDLSTEQFDFLRQNVESVFYCLHCKPRNSYADLIFDQIQDPSYNAEDPHNSTTDTITSFSSAHDSDFEWVTDSDPENDLRGLNFDSLPVQNTVPNNIALGKNKIIPARLIHRKYPCIKCFDSCRKNQNCIQCNICDEWIHQTCSNLTINEFKTYCSPEHEGDPYYCDNCRFGHANMQNLGKLDCPSATTLNSINIDESDVLTPNSIFRDKEDITTSEYYTLEELNIEMEKTPEDILILHINTVSLIDNDNFSKFKNLLASFKPIPSILCLSETRIPLKPTDLQLSQIRFNGFHKPIFESSPTSAGGVAIYVSESLSFVERSDVKFNYPDCEACFVEVESDTPNPNPIFGALYRHPKIDIRAFTSHLGEFLENFAFRGNALTIMGDFNIDLNIDSTPATAN